MSEQTTETTETAPAETTKPQSLEELLADIDEDRRKVILEQVEKPRKEAKNLRERLRAAEPKVAEYDRLAAASQTEQERAQAAQAAADEKVLKANQRAARSDVKAAVAAAGHDAEKVVKRLDMSLFVDDDGDVDEQAVADLIADLGPVDARRAPRPDTSQASAANGQSKTDPGQQFAAFIKQQL